MTSLLVILALGSYTFSTTHPELGSAPARVKLKWPPMGLSSWLLIRPFNKSFISIICSECLVSLWMNQHGYLVITRLSVTVPLFHTLPSPDTGMPCPTIVVTKLSLPVLSTLNSCLGMKTPVTFLQRTFHGPKPKYLLYPYVSGKAKLCLLAPLPRGE